MYHYIKSKIFILVPLFLSVTLFSCKKYLDAKPDKSLVIPTQVSQLQELLDQNIMYSDYPIAGAIADDNFYYTYDSWSSLDINSMNTYIWGANADISTDYSNAYTRILNANVVLNVIDTLHDNGSTQADRNNVKGSALFYRASNFYELAQLFAPQYSSATANTGYGIPLKVSPNAEDVTTRSTVKETYDKIISDLKEAMNLLPSTIIYKTRPSKPAAYALLARTYLVIGEYDSSLNYANLCLQLKNNLIDYNTISYNDAIPFSQLNDEVIFHAQSSINSSGFNAQLVDSSLYISYGNNDIRKKAFFDSTTGSPAGTFTFKGNYNANTYSMFTGIAVDEVYLIRAESHARKGNVQSALNDLDTLLRKRFDTTYVPYTASDAVTALKIVLSERRKELCFRPGLRWSDLRRLNLDDNFKVTIKRVLNGQTYQLLPDDLRYTFLMPPSVVTISGIAQNKR